LAQGGLTGFAGEHWLGHQKEDPDAYSFLMINYETGRRTFFLGLAAARTRCGAFSA